MLSTFIDHHTEIFKMAYYVALIQVAAQIVFMPSKSKLNSKNLSNVHPLFLLFVWGIGFVPYLNFFAMLVLARKHTSIMQAFNKV